MRPRFNENDGPILSYYDANTEQPIIKSNEIVRYKPMIKDVKNARFDLSRNIKMSTPVPDSDKINLRAIGFLSNNPVTFTRTPTTQVQSWKNSSSIAHKLRRSIDNKNTNYLPRIDSLTTREFSSAQRVEKRRRHPPDAVVPNN